MRPGLTPATVQIPSHAVDIKDGLDLEMPQMYLGWSQPIPNLVP